MATTIRLSGFNTKATPVLADIIYAGDSANAFDEVQITVSSLINAYPNLTGIGGLTLGANTYPYVNAGAVFTAGTITALGVSLLAGTTIAAMQLTLGYTATVTGGRFAGWDANLNLSANSFIAGYATTATAATTTTLVASSANQQYFTGSTTQTVLLPVTSTLALGQSFRIVNNSSGIVTVQSSGANTIQAMAANTTLLVTCILTSGTSAASWSAFYSLSSAITVPVSLANGGTGASLTASNGGLVYSTGSVLAILAGTATALQIPLSGASSAPSWSTMTYLATIGINQIPFASSANILGVISAVNSAVMVSSAGGVPSMSTVLPAGITMTSDPSTALGIATKQYVDQTSLNGTSVYAASAATLGTVTQSGAGVGATLTNAGAQATFALDGVNPPVGANVLIKNTATGMTAANEGIYTVVSVGSGASNWSLVRATSYDTTTEINNTGIIVVQNGSTLAGTGWYNSATIATVDTTAFSYSQFGQPTAFTQIIQTLVTSTQAFTPNASTKYIGYNIVGGGGGAGGASASATGASAGEGGSGAGSSQGIVTRATWVGAGTAATITIGAAGTGGTAGSGNGGTGGTSSIVANSGAGATLAQATGGAGGQGDTNHAANNSNTTNPAPGVGSLGILNLTGGYGQSGLSLTTAANGGFGGDAAGGWGQGGPTNNNGAGSVGTGYGAGGGGGAAITNTNRAGAVGLIGACLVTEYI